MLKTDLPELAAIESEVRLLNGRLDRAYEHLATFGRLWGEYLASRPHELTYKALPDGTLAVCLHRRSPLSVELSLVFGELVYELRAALDNCLYATAVLVSGENPPPDASRLEWPIREDLKAWKAQLSRYRALPDEVRDALERIQPYRADFPDWNSLKILHDLARIDRHRSPHGLGLYLAHVRIKANLDEIAVLGQGRPGIVEDGGEIVRLRVKSGVELTPSNFDVNLEFDVDVSDVQEVAGPKVESGRPWGSLYVRMRSVIEAVDDYTTGIIAIGIQCVSTGHQVESTTPDGEP